MKLYMVGNTTIIGLSFNGRTRLFESLYIGSIPISPANATIAQSGRAIGFQPIDEKFKSSWSLQTFRTYPRGYGFFVF